MAKVKWADGIEYVSGLMTKRPKAGSMHSDHSTALLATHRVAATTSEYWQKADTSVVIQTKTIETYDASRKL